MKKIHFLIIFTLLTIGPLKGQQISFQFDVKNAFYGSTVNKPSFNYIIKVTDLYNYSQNLELGIFFEQFKEINYLSYGVTSNYRILNFDKFHFLTAVELSMITRNYPEKANLSYYSYGFNQEFRYIINNIGLQLSINSKRRTDQNYWNSESKFVHSMYIGIVYIL